MQRHTPATRDTEILLMQPHIPTHRRLTEDEPQPGTCILRVRGDRDQYGQELPPSRGQPSRALGRKQAEAGEGRAGCKRLAAHVYARNGPPVCT